MHGIVGKKELKEERVEKRKNKKIFSSIFVKFRRKLEGYRRKNPKVFDWMIHVVEIVWFIISTFCAEAATNYVVLFVSMLSAFLALYVIQWAILTNKSERYLVLKEEEYNKNAKELQEFSHAVAHTIKICISKMQYERMALVRERLVDFLTSGLNTMEDILSKHYGEPICASVKLCTKKDTLKTYARGKNNVENRGGKAKVTRLNKQEINIKSNYAYNALIERKLQYFSEGNLINIKEKENDEDEFYCEYDDWQDKFMASIIIPIRYPVMNDQELEYKVLGIICIDAKTEKPEWSVAQESFAYKTVAFFADAVYSLIDHYMKKQTQIDKKRRT